MKKQAFFVALLFISSISFSQQYKIQWGEEMKLKKGTADLDIISADNTGLYFTEERKGGMMFSIGGGATNYKLYKFDKNFGEVFDKEYKKELKGLDFQSFQVLGNDIYLFATDYIKKEKAYKVFGVKIDKNSGALMGDFAELGSYELESKKDDFEMKITPVHNNTSFLMVSNISAKDRVSIAVAMLDKTLKRKESAVINLSFEPNLYQLEDVQVSKNNRIILLGREYEETQIGKKKRKKLVFKQYAMGVYDADGKKINDVKLDGDDRYILSGKLIEQPDGQMLLAGFYCNNAKKEDLNGFFINKVNPENGSLSLSSYKEITPDMLGKAFEDETDEDEETKESRKRAKKAKEDEDEDEFPNSFVIKSVDINPVDNSIIISSEISKYSHYTYTHSQYNGSTRSWTYTTYHVHRFDNKDILIINADKDGGIKWINAVAKSQREEIQSSSRSFSGLSFSYDNAGYFATRGGMPYYSSYKSLINGNNLVLILNDHNSNNVNPAYGDKVKSVYNFRKRSSAYGISIDLSSGKMTRKLISSNNDETILMPRHAFVVKNELYVPSWRLHMMAKTELKFAKITVK